jgi:hypothetical protein
VLEYSGREPLRRRWLAHPGRSASTSAAPRPVHSLWASLGLCFGFLIVLLQPFIAPLNSSRQTAPLTRHLDLPPPISSTPATPRGACAWCQFSCARKPLARQYSLYICRAVGLIAANRQVLICFLCLGPTPPVDLRHVRLSLYQCVTALQSLVALLLTRHQRPAGAAAW